jgi:hypothetical protein
MRRIDLSRQETSGIALVGMKRRMRLLPAPGIGIYVTSDATTPMTPLAHRQARLHQPLGSALDSHHQSKLLGATRTPCAPPQPLKQRECKRDAKASALVRNNSARGIVCARGVFRSNGHDAPRSITKIYGWHWKNCAELAGVCAKDLVQYDADDKASRLTVEEDEH